MQLKISCICFSSPSQQLRKLEIMAETNVVYEYLVAQVKPKYLIQMMEEMKNGRKMFEKHSAKTLGLWLTECGDMGKIVRLMEWRKH